MNFILYASLIVLGFIAAWVLVIWTAIYHFEAFLLALLSAALAVVVTGSRRHLARYSYRAYTALLAVKSLYTLPQDKVDSFLKSYQLFDAEVVGAGHRELIVDYYSILNHLCSIGEVEKMYIPPIIDPDISIMENQELFERKLCRDLHITETSRVLDIGCGRGRVLAHIAQTTGAAVCTGLNIDDDQLANARRYAKDQGIDDRVSYVHANFNDPLPFPDASFDVVYQIQVLTYAKSKQALFAEMYRVLKPGGRLSFLDWVKSETYDEKNPHHVDIIKAVKPLIGAVDTPTGAEFKSVLEEVGFKVTFSGDISDNGHQADLIESADNYFNIVNVFINVLVFFKVLPAHFQILFARLIKDGDKFIEGDRLGLFTTSYQTLAEKPLNSGHKEN